MNPTLCKTTSRKPRRLCGCFAVLLRLAGKCIFSKDPFFMCRDKHNFGKTMVRLICESTSHLRAGLEIPPLLTHCFDSVPVLPQHSWNRCNVGNCAIKWAQSRSVCGASAKFYLHAHCFLYKLDYYSKWNTLKKNKNKTLLTSSQEEARLIRAKPEGFWRENWPEPFKTSLEKVCRQDCETVTSRRWWSDVSPLFLFHFTCNMSQLWMLGIRIKMLCQSEGVE